MLRSTGRRPKPARLLSPTLGLRIGVLTQENQHVMTEDFAQFAEVPFVDAVALELLAGGDLEGCAADELGISEPGIEMRFPDDFRKPFEARP